MDIKQLVEIAEERELLRRLFHQYQNAFPYQHNDHYFVNKLRSQRLDSFESEISKKVISFKRFLTEINFEDLNKLMASKYWFGWSLAEDRIKDETEFESIKQAFINLIETLLENLVASTGYPLSFEILFTENESDELAFSIKNNTIFIPKYLIYHMLVVIGMDLKRMKATSSPTMADRQTIYDFVRQFAEVINQARESTLRSIMNANTSAQINAEPILNSNAEFRDSFWMDFITSGRKLFASQPGINALPYYEAVQVALIGADLDYGLPDTYKKPTISTEPISDEAFLYIATNRMFSNQDLNRIIKVLKERFKSDSDAFVSEVIFGFLAKLVGYDLNESAFHIRKFLVAISSERARVQAISRRLLNLESSILNDFPNARQDPTLINIVLAIDHSTDILEKIKFWES